jgi:capsular polysaccharide biosynthesis protein
MELRDYWRLIRRRAWIPIVLLAVTLPTAITLTLLSKPQYTATATVVAKSGLALGFADVATSNTVIARAISDAGGGLSVDQLANRIHISSPRTNVYKIAVTDADPGRAAALANAVAKEGAADYHVLAGGSNQSLANDLQKSGSIFRDQYLAAAKALVDFGRQHPEAVGTNPHPRDSDTGAKGLQLQLDERAASDAYIRFEQQVTAARVEDLVSARNYPASVTDEAVAVLDSTGRILRIGYAAGLAFAVGLGLIFLLEYLDHSIHLPEEAEEMTGSPVIGVIPRGTSRTLRPAKGGVA